MNVVPAFLSSPSQGVAHGSHPPSLPASDLPMSRFQTTRWSLIEAARDDPARSRLALEALCTAYRPPVLAFVRHSGYGRIDAEDLTQSFFLRFLESGWYEHADPERGRFRSLLLTTLRHFLSDQRAQAVAGKRGGAHMPGSDIDIEQLPGDADPEAAFTRAWMQTVLERAMARLQAECAKAGKLEQFLQLSTTLAERADAAELRDQAESRGVRANTLAVQAHRLRRRLRQLVRLELLQTVGSREALEQELAELRSVLDASG